MNPTTDLTKAELDVVSYKAASAAAAAAQQTVNARFDELEKKLAIVAVAGAALWFLTRRH